MNNLLEILRNPQGWNDHVVRDARLIAADEIERLTAENAALKAAQSEPVAWVFTDAWGTHYTDDKREWFDAVGIESVTPLYSTPQPAAAPEITK